MTAQKAYQILGIIPGSGKDEIKKRYRKLMTQVHPDVSVSLQENYKYNAQEINSAYTVLMKEKGTDTANNSHTRKCRASREKKNVVWDAPVNVNAYAEREVLQYAEEYDGTVLGTYCVATGKYLWKTDEDFPLFLRSMYQCSKELLDGIDEKLHRDEVMPKRRQIQAELTYLLAQQFIDGSALLEELAQEQEITPDGDKIYYLSSMLELANGAAFVKEGEALYPSVIRNHKLYLKNQAGQELGYLSFPDDRLYYLVIPLFEQKRVQVKVQAAEIKTEKRRKTIRYQKMRLWLKLPRKDVGRLPENLNLQIEKLLENYRTCG